MARSLPIFAMLLAQVVNMVLMTCAVRCVGADGHECLEFSGQVCVACDSHPERSDAKEHSDADGGGGCCSQHDAEADQCETGLPAEVNDPCECEHSRYAPEYCIAARASVPDVQQVAWSAVVFPGHAEFHLDAGWSVDRWRAVLPPCWSPHLLIVEIAVLRV